MIKFLFLSIISLKFFTFTNNATVNVNYLILKIMGVAMNLDSNMRELNFFYFQGHSVSVNTAAICYGVPKANLTPEAEDWRLINISNITVIK